MKIKIIFGLGNPEERYQGTYHNLGLQALRRFETLQDEKPWSGLRLVSSTVSMNESGTSVRKLLSEHGIKPEQLLVIHDDSDLMIGKVKLSFGQNPAGHKGVESIIHALGTKDFWRLRVGFRKKEEVENGRGRAKASELVLKKISRDDQAILETVFGTLPAIILKTLT